MSAWRKLLGGEVNQLSFGRMLRVRLVRNAEKLRQLSCRRDDRKSSRNVWRVFTLRKRQENRKALREQRKLRETRALRTESRRQVS